MAYAIVFDIDTNLLQKAYHNTSYNNAYSDIRRVLENYGFEWQQGSTYFGNQKVDAVACVLAVQELSAKYDWFSA
ncbi:MAG: virulence factor, partial [Rhizobiales bacterium]|nr:virulence factor [Hyphomicrobiales bacterium]